MQGIRIKSILTSVDHFILFHGYFWNNGKIKLIGREKLWQQETNAIKK